MSQCVPNWNLDETPPAARFTLHPNSNPVFTAQDETMLDYEVAELTWVNGHLAMQGLGPPRILSKTLSNSSKTTWDKPRANGTLESIVNQATTLRPSGDEQVPLFNPHRSSSAVAGDRLTVDALVPCSNPKTTTSGDNQSTHVQNPNPVPDTCVVECSTRVGSCSGVAMAERGEGEEEKLARKRMRVARVPVAHEGSSRIQSESTSATFGGDSISRQVTLDTCEMDLDVGLTSTSMGSPSPGNTSTGKPSTVDDHDSVCHSKPQKEVGNDVEKKKNQTGKSSISTKRSRAAAIHNQSERKRRDKINQRMKTLQKMVPNSSKTDKASMLDEVIEYLKQLQAQVQMMSRINMPQMMLPMTMQQQLQMSMMAQMGIGVGMGMGMGMGVMDINSIARPNIPGISPVMHPSPFMPLNSWDNSGDRVCSPSTVMPDPLSTFLACQTQPMTMDAYSRMAALYQQLHQQLGSNPKT